MVVLAVILAQVVFLFKHLSTSEVQSDLPVLAGGVAKLSELLLLFPQLLPLTGGQPLIGFGGKVIGLIIQNLCSPDTAVERNKNVVLSCVTYRM